MLYAIAAMRNEAETLLSQAVIKNEDFLFGKTVWSGEAFGRPFALILSGIGKSNAAAAAMLALTRGADRLLNFGVAGGITPKASVGALLQIDRAAQYDFDLSGVNGTPVGTLDEYETPYFPLLARKNGFLKGTLATGDRFVDGNTDDAVLHALKADVRDMEGAAIAHIAHAAGVPCSMFKSVSDNAGEESIREYRENLRDALRLLAERMKEIFEEAYFG